jgi:hypothetical protein
MTYLPASHRVTFTLDPDRGRYIVAECDPGFTRVPRELVVEDRRFNKDIRAELLLRGTETEKKTGPRSVGGRSVKFFTGLLPTATPNVYLGNVLTWSRGKKVQNGVAVRFSTDAGRMTLLYFPAYYPYPDQRAAFVATLISRGLL